MGKNRIVIVDDEVDMTQLLRIELETEGFEVFVAFDGDMGADLVKKMLPDLVLLDVMMPKKDGYEVLKELKDDPSTQNIPVVMLTAKGLEEEIQKGLDMGVDDYISKPFHPGLLLKKIQTILK